MKPGDIPPELIERLVSLSTESVVDRVLGRPGNEALKKEWAEILEMERETMIAFQRALSETDCRQMLEYAKVVMGNLPLLLSRKWAARRFITRLVELDVPGPFVIKEKKD